MKRDWNKIYPFVLVDVDTQNDFIDPKGGLYMPGAVHIIPNLERLFRWAGVHQVPVISTVDAHVPEDPEFREFPPHCVVGTWGHEKIPATTLHPCRRSSPDEAGENIRIEAVFRDYLQIVFEKRTYRVFDNPNIEKTLAKMPAKVFVVCGVATDYCVGAVVDKLLELKKKVWLVADAIAAVVPGEGERWVADFKNRGVRLVTTAEPVFHR